MRIFCIVGAMVPSTIDTTGGTSAGIISRTSLMFVYTVFGHMAISLTLKTFGWFDNKRRNFIFVAIQINELSISSLVELDIQIPLAPNVYFINL